MVAGISSIVDSVADALSLDPKPKSDGILEYDENGNVVGVKGKTEDEDKKTLAKAKDNSNVQMNVMKYQEDIFVRQTEKEEEAKVVQAEEAQKKKVNIDDAYKKYAKAIKFDDASMLKELNDKNIITNRELISFEHFKHKLVSGDASDTTVIESVKKFLDKAQRLQELAEKFVKDKKEEEKATNPFTVETAMDNYDKFNPLGIDEDEDMFNNNFFSSAFDTSEVEDDKKADKKDEDMKADTE